MDDVRITVAVATLLNAFLEDPAEARYGYDLMRHTGFPSGKLYPILARLETAGWLVKETEAVDPVSVGRPPRRLYRLSGEGQAAAERELTMMRHRIRPRTVQVPMARPAAGTP